MSRTVRIGHMESQSLHELKINSTFIIHTLQNAMDETTNVKIIYV